jgi:hypothetical protein
MANAVNTVETLNGYFKESYADKIQDLVPEGVKLLKLIDFNSAEKSPGNLYHQPLDLGLEHGVTYGGSGGDAFALNASIASSSADAQVRGCEMVLVSAISVGAASRSASSKNAFEQITKRKVQNMLKSIHVRLEVQLLYGQVGIGRVEGVSTNTISICDAEWAPGIWVGATNMAIEIRSQAGTVRGSCYVQSVNMDNKTITVDLAPSGVTGNADSENSAADVIWYKGAYNKEFAGLHKMITNTGTLFNVDAATYELFKGNTIQVGTSESAKAFISFEKVEEAVARAMEKGLDEQDVVCLVHPKHWNKLMTDLASKRVYDSSYSDKEFKQGAKALKFASQVGEIEIVSSLYVKEGFAYVFSPEDLERIGSQEVTFEMPGMEGKFFKLMESANGYELRLYTDQALFSHQIGKMSILKYIKAE